MRLTIHHVHYIDPAAMAVLESLMSDLTDAVAELKKAAQDALAHSLTVASDARAKIADLEAQHEADAADHAAVLKELADLKAQFDAVDPTHPATVESVPPKDEPASETPTPAA